MKPLTLRAEPSAAIVLDALGRTEDVAAAPDGRSAVIAAFNRSELAWVDYEVVDEGGSREVVVSTATAMGHHLLSRPHGLTFLDQHTLVVANREAEVVCIEIDAGRIESCRVLLDGTHRVPVHSPGSVAARWVTDELAELVVCNNYAHDVTRYLLDAVHGWAVVDAERLLAKGMAIPDGVAVSHDGEWVAISNHDTHSVFVYRNAAGLGPDSEPDGVLEGPNYPHGLVFSRDGTRLLLADAGLPYVYTYEVPAGDWAGTHRPVETTRVMDDDVFNRARYNPQEGGPKGIDMDASGIAMVTGDQLPLAFYDLGVSPPGPVTEPSRELRRLAARAAASDDAAAARAAELAEVQEEREHLLGELAAARAELAASHADADNWRDSARASAEAAAEAAARIELMESTFTWRAHTRLLPLLRPLARLKSAARTRRRG